MFKSIKASKDTYVTNKVVNSHRMTGSNVGAAGTLDLFKLYGSTYSGSTPNVELSRILLHFDLSDIRTDITNRLISVRDSSFKCYLSLKDVYGGQPTPTNFKVTIFPLSASFAEGLGKDVGRLSDLDTANWISNSVGNTWFVTGCNLPCNPSSGPGDYVTASSTISNTEVTQTFVTGEEDLYVDVTQILSATLTNNLPDQGFRLALSSSHEDDTRSYFVKRFGSRTAYDESKRPRLIVKFDDSISDDTQNLTFDATRKLTLYNGVGGTLRNIVSGTSQVGVSGSNCLYLKMVLPVSGGSRYYYFTGSQFSFGSSTTDCYVSGVYQADVSLSAFDAYIRNELYTSSSLSFTPVWYSLDGSVAYVTGSSLTFKKNDRSGYVSLTPKKYDVTVYDVKSDYTTSETPTARVNIFDRENPDIKNVRLPESLPTLVFSGCYYQVRNAVTNEVVVPFDDVHNSTRVSSNSYELFFKFNTSSLLAGESYVFDILLVQNGQKTYYMAASPTFRVSA